MNEEKPIIAERIKFLRKEKGYTQEQLADLLGLSAKSSIANYESGANAPSDEIKAKICELFGCSMDYLIGKSEFKTIEEDFDNYAISQRRILILKTIERYHSEYVIKYSLKEEDVDFIVDILCDVNEKNIKEKKEKIDKYVNSFAEEDKTEIRKFINIIIKELIEDLKVKSIFHYFYSLIDNKKENINNVLSNKFYMCPVYGRISAGQPNWAEECIEGRIPIDPDYMNITEPTECYFLRVNGESMNKEIKNGAYALIRRTDFVENGEIAVVLVNGYDATLKKFSQQGDLVILEPMSNDPSFTTQVYGKDTEIKIIGKYIGKMEMK